MRDVKTVAVKVDPELERLIDQIADRQRWSRSDVLRQGVLAQVEALEAKGVRLRKPEEVAA